LYNRVGVPFAMVWLSVGAILGFNVCFNYTMACLIKAVGPTDLKKIE